MQEFNCSNEIPAFESVLPTLSETTETLGTFLPSVSATTYPIFLNIPYAGTIASLTIQGSAGSGTATVKIAGQNVPGLTGITISSTEGTFYATSGTFLALDDITIAFSAASGLTNCSINLSVIRAIPATTNTTITLPSGTTTDGSKQESINFNLISGQVLQPVPFAIQKTDSGGIPTASYIVSGLVYNATDNTHITVMNVGQTSLGLTLQCNAPPPTSIYYFKGQALVL